MSGSSWRGTEGLKYGRHESANALETLDDSRASLGQRNPQHCPLSDAPLNHRESDPLGPPMTIREIARMLGCSVWSVRQRYLPVGLPHLRVSRTGKLLFFHNQVVRWVLDRQRQKGGY